ncbi:MAG: DUF1697 domain-containing protein [Streptosporangiales bacterium]|nr:DUF1697 domain-containing protein [Streptosporangiales bacterium]
MARYAALLRGINLGRTRKVPMADLRALLDRLGYRDVWTVLNSGNAVFTGDDMEPADLEKELEAALAAEFAMDVPCLVRTADEMRATVADNPLGQIATNGSRLMAHFLSVPPEPAVLAAHDPVELDPERVRVGDRVIYQWCPDGLVAAPPVGDFVAKHLGVTVTTRNWNTVTKLGDLLDS